MLRKLTLSTIFVLAGATGAAAQNAMPFSRIDSVTIASASGDAKPGLTVEGKLTTGTVTKVTLSMTGDQAAIGEHCFKMAMTAYTTKQTFITEVDGGVTLYCKIANFGPGFDEPSGPGFGIN